MKFKTIFIVVLILIFVHSSSILAQEAPIATESATTGQSLIKQAEADYRYQYDLYRNAHFDYVRTKKIWQSSKSLKAEQEAITAAKLVATTRVDVLSAYIRWVRLQLLEFASVYPKVVDIAVRLEAQNNLLLVHKTKIESVTTIIDFDKIMAEYSDPLATSARNSLFAIAQLELKLANLAYYQHQSRSLYDPVLKIVEPKTGIPEVESGLVRIKQLGDTINTELVDLGNFSGSLESESFSEQSFFKKANERLSQLHTNQINLLNFIIELESRYGHD